MSDCAIQETFVIPSRGLLYDCEMNPEITLRSMTTQEEMKRLSHSENQYKLLSEILDDCGVKDCGMSSYDMCIGDFQFLIYKLRIVTYGPEYEVSSTCPYCGFTNEGTINLEELPVLEYDESIEKYRMLELPVSGKRVGLSYQTPRMLDDITEKVKEFKRKSSSSFDPTLMFTIVDMIDFIDDDRADPALVENWVRNLPMKDTQTILAYIDKYTTSMGVDIQLHNTCDLCGLDFDSTLRINNEFFRPTLHI